MNLNGSWQFELFAAGKEEDEKAFGANRTKYHRTIQMPFSWVCPLSGVEENVAGIGWYCDICNDGHCGELACGLLLPVGCGYLLCRILLVGYA